MIQAMYSGISGMRAFKSNLDVIGNNVANVNTVAYKAGRATFKEMLSQTLSGAAAPSGSRGGVNPSQVGLGVNIGSVDLDQTQGSMQATGRQTDLAIEGNGFFALGDGSNIQFTRDGTFGLDAQYNLVSAATGMKVLGWSADPTTGVIDTSEPVTGASEIRIPVGGLSLARQTELIRLGGNLEAGAAANTQREIKFSIYDSLGLTHEMRVVFTKADPTSGDPTLWTYEVYCEDADPANPVGTGALTFDDRGHSELAEINLSMNLTLPNGSVRPIDFTINTSDMSYLNGQFTADMTFQDGLPLGTLESFYVDRNGFINGTFTNGTTRPLGQIAIAEFNNPAGLTKTGNNMWSVSPNSGAPRIGVPGTSSRGLISAGFLEASNVDLAKEFANMIVAQRGFQANSRIITVSDEVLQELVSLMR